MSEDKIFMCDTNEEAIEKAKSTIEENDCVLVKASNSMRFNEIVNALTK